MWTVFSVAVFCQCAGCMHVMHAGQGSLISPGPVAAACLVPHSLACVGFCTGFTGALRISRVWLDRVRAAGSCMAYSSTPGAHRAHYRSRVCRVGLLCNSSITTICVAYISLAGSSCHDSNVAVVAAVVTWYPL